MAERYAPPCCILSRPWAVLYKFYEELSRGGKKFLGRLCRNLSSERDVIF
jgi:hypothetical protein